jgi:hypothetical protein
VLKKVIEDRALVRDYRAKAQESSRSRFDWAEVTRQTESFYYEILEKKKLIGRQETIAITSN